MTDPIADFLTCLRNGSQALIPEVTCPHSRIKEHLARLLKQEGYISDLSVQGDKIKSLKIKLKFRGKKRVIEGLRRISTPGLRRYVPVGEIPRVLGGMGVAILSTPRGLMTGAEAARNKVGGEVLCYVW
jgi:small subunit ribosomal protein S8